MTIDQAIEMLIGEKNNGNTENVFLTFIGDADYEHNLTEKAYSQYKSLSAEKKAELDEVITEGTQSWFEDNGCFGTCFRSALKDNNLEINEELVTEQLTFN